MMILWRPGALQSQRDTLHQQLAQEKKRSDAIVKEVTMAERERGSAALSRAKESAKVRPSALHKRSLQRFTPKA